MSVPPNFRMSGEDYLLWESGQSTRSELHGGQVIAMAGSSYDHGRIAANVVWRLTEDLRSTDCFVLSQDMRVKCSEADYFYPDIVVHCGPPEIEEPAPGSLTNPILIIEVLSSSTEKTDRSTKLVSYQGMPSVQAILLVSSDPRMVELYERGASKWTWQGFIGSQGEVTLSVGGTEVVLSLSDIFFGLSADQQS